MMRNFIPERKVLRKRISGTPGTECVVPTAETHIKIMEVLVMANQKMRIKLKAFDHNVMDQSAAKIVATAKRSGAEVKGPIPLPTEKEIVTILRAVHKYKDSREQFELKTHKRLIDILKPNQKAVDALTSLELPAGVEIDIKL